jgi:hypothetical protein
MTTFEIYVDDVMASDFRSPENPTLTTSESSDGSKSSQASRESDLPKDYESLPIFSYNIDTTKTLTWDSDAQSLHGLWMQNANTGNPNDRYPHAAIKRLMRLNPEVFQVCSEVLAPFSLLADMFVGMLLMGASGVGDEQQTVLTEQDVIHAIALNPLLTWALDVIDVDELLNMHPAEQGAPTIIANVLPELLVRQHPKHIMKKLIEAHFKLLSVSDVPLGEIPVILDANSQPITKSAVLVSDDFSETGELRDVQKSVDPYHANNRPSCGNSGIVPDESHAEFSNVVGLSEIPLSGLVTKNQELPEIADNFFIPACTLNKMCQHNENQVIHPYSPSSQQMDYVHFFSHIDPIWFPNEVGNLEVDTGNLEEPLDEPIHCVSRNNAEIIGKSELFY